MPEQSVLTGQAQPAPTPCIGEDDFRDLIAWRARRLLPLARYLEERAMSSTPLTRPLLGDLLSEAGQIEELLDAYGAKNNRRWAPFRHLIAGCRLFAGINYKLLHIQHSLTIYHLLPVEGNLHRDTDEALLFVSNVIMLIATRLVAEGRLLGLPEAEQMPVEADFSERLPPGHLPQDRTARHINSARETVTELATAFLNLAAASAGLHDVESLDAAAGTADLPEAVREKNLHRVEEEFHNLQTLYDTYVSDTDTECLDGNLKTLRGHISLIYHLLETATAFSHFYERHVATSGGETRLVVRPLINPVSLLEVLVNYSLTYASRYLAAGRTLCQAMLKRYAVIERIRVPVPCYRGFHVRPSTLVARIVHHYGSEVRMYLDEEPYDAGAPLDLFRANEKINAAKRRAIAEEVTRIAPQGPCHGATGALCSVRELIRRLDEENRIVVHERPLPLEDLKPQDGESVAEFAMDEIARLLAGGKIDIETDLAVEFEGDRRVLNDLKLLAENGYGEDAAGNNTPLPAALGYLRRESLR